MHAARDLSFARAAAHRTCRLLSSALPSVALSPQPFAMQEPPEVQAVMLKLRASLKRRGAEGIRGLGRHFKVRGLEVTRTSCHLYLAGCTCRITQLAQICDRNRNGQLDDEEFEKCCRLNNLGLNSQEIGILYRFFDRDHSGGISYNEFLRVVRGRLSPVRKQIVKKIFDVLDKCATRPYPHAMMCVLCPSQ